MDYFLSAQVIEFSIIGIFSIALAMTLALNIGKRKIIDAVEYEEMQATTCKIFPDVDCTTDALNIGQIVFTPYGTSVRYLRGDEFEVLEKVFIKNKIYNFGDIITMRSLGYVFTDIPDNLSRRDLEVKYLKSIYC